MNKLPDMPANACHNIHMLKTFIISLAIFKTIFDRWISSSIADIQEWWGELWQYQTGESRWWDGPGPGRGTNLRASCSGSETNWGRDAPQTLTAAAWYCAQQTGNGENNFIPNGHINSQVLAILSRAAAVLGHPPGF